MSARKYWIRQSDGEKKRGLTIRAFSDTAARERAVIAMAAHKGPWQLETTDRGSDQVRIVVKHIWANPPVEDDENPLNLPI